MIRWIKRTAVLGAAVLLQLYGAAAYYAWQLPDNYYVQTGSQLEVDTALHISAVPTAHTVQAAAASARTAETTSLRLFGVIPVKEVEVQEIDTPMLVPCGEPFGIKLRMDGAMVVGMERVDTPEGKRCPAQEAGIQTGDLIRSVDGQVIDSNQSLQDAIADSDGVPVTVTLERGEETCTVTLTPAYAAMRQASGCGTAAPASAPSPFMSRKPAVSAVWGIPSAMPTPATSCPLVRARQLL